MGQDYLQDYKTLKKVRFRKDEVIYELPFSPNGRMQGIWRRFNSKNQLEAILHCNFPAYKWRRVVENRESWLLHSTSKPTWMHGGGFGGIKSFDMNIKMGISLI